MLGIGRKKGTEKPVLKRRRELFDDDYIFTGSHATRVKRLTEDYNKEEQYALFKHNKDVYLMAPLVGYSYKRRAEKNNEGDEKASVLQSQISGIKKQLMLHYHLIILLDEQYEPDFEKRVDKAFRNYGTEAGDDDYERYDKYVRGGVDVLYEKLIQENVTDKPRNRLINFLKDYNERFNDKVNNYSNKELLAEMLKD